MIFELQKLVLIACTTVLNWSRILLLGTRKKYNMRTYPCAHLLIHSCMHRDTHTHIAFVWSTSLSAILEQFQCISRYVYGHTTRKSGWYVNQNSFFLSVWIILKKELLWCYVGFFFNPFLSDLGKFPKLLWFSILLSENYDNNITLKIRIKCPHL